MEQHSFTREYIVEKLDTLGTNSGLGVASWNSNSFRRGAAPWAAEVGLPEAQIQTLGRWRSSDSYKAYIEYLQEEQIPLSKRFQGTQPRQGH